jgi:hypothetical protein
MLNANDASVHPSPPEVTELRSAREGVPLYYGSAFVPVRWSSFGPDVVVHLTVNGLIVEHIIKGELGAPPLQQTIQVFYPAVVEMHLRSEPIQMPLQLLGKAGGTGNFIALTCHGSGGFGPGPCSSCSINKLSF